VVVPDARSLELVLELVTVGLAVVEPAFDDVVGEGAGALDVGATVRIGLVSGNEHCVLTAEELLTHVYSILSSPTATLGRGPEFVQCILKVCFAAE
jgi:hypothetical protein